MTNDEKQLNEQLNEIGMLEGPDKVIVWNEPYVFRRLSGAGEQIIRDRVSYRVIGSRVIRSQAGVSHIETILRKDRK